jgi:ribonuclease VapC
VILDSSAVIAIVRDEPEQREFATLIGDDPAPLISAPTLLECLLVSGAGRAHKVGELLQVAGVDIVPFDESHARVAAAAHAAYGKGSGSQAGLNFGDCMTYALAKVTGQPLLFKGDDFTHTDVKPAR